MELPGVLRPTAAGFISPASGINLIANSNAISIIVITHITSLSLEE